MTMRKVHSKPRPDVTIYDLIDHPLYLHPSRRYDATIIDGNGSRGVYGATPEEALARLDAIIFEDADGKETPMTVDLEGIIREPYAQRGHTPTIGEIVAFGVMVTGLAMFWIGVGR